MNTLYNKGLLIVAHGSKVGASNREVFRFTKTVKQKLMVEHKSEFKNVAACFLELARPSISTAMYFLVQRGVTKICIFPYFLAFGTHVSADVPMVANNSIAEINAMQRKEAKIEIQLMFLPHLGKMPQLTNAVCSYVQQVSK